jgi:hypothetical protein
MFGSVGKPAVSGTTSRDSSRDIRTPRWARLGPPAHGWSPSARAVVVLYVAVRFVGATGSSALTRASSPLPRPARVRHRRSSTGHSLRMVSIGVQARRNVRTARKRRWESGSRRDGHLRGKERRAAVLSRQAASTVADGRRGRRRGSRRPPRPIRLGRPDPLSPDRLLPRCQTSRRPISRGPMNTKKMTRQEEHDLGRRSREPNPTGTPASSPSTAHRTGPRAIPRRDTRARPTPRRRRRPVRVELDPPRRRPRAADHRAVLPAAQNRAPERRLQRQDNPHRTHGRVGPRGTHSRSDI